MRKEENQSADQSENKRTKAFQNGSQNREYRLVSLDYNNGNYEDEIDLLDLAHVVWKYKKYIFRFVFAGIFLGLLVAFTSPVEYKASSNLMPEYSAESSGGAADFLRKYGGLVGMSGGSFSSGENVLRVDLYPQIVKSTPFQMEFMEMEFYSIEYDQQVTVFDYFNEVHGAGVMKQVFKYTIGLPYVIKDWVTPEKDNNLAGIQEDKLLRLTEEEVEVLELLKERITAGYDEATGVITVSAEMPEAELSAQIAQVAIDNLTEYLVEYRTEKGNRDLEFIEEQLALAKERFEVAKINLAEFTDSNRGNLTARAEAEKQSLESEYNLTFSVYQSLSQQYEQAKITVQEQTPVFKVLQPVQVPIEKSKPKRAIIMIVFTFLFGVLGVFYAVVYGKFFTGNNTIIQLFREKDKEYNLAAK